jgi:hypothetical protein
VINPRLIFRGDDRAQERYMKDWYLNPADDRSTIAKSAPKIAA